MRSLQHILCIFVVLHFGPSFYKCIECALVIKPQNAIALIGEVVTLQCASSVKDNIAWRSSTSGEDYVYYGKTLEESVSTYISVSDRDDGNCSLHINASQMAAKKYICLDREAGEQASAELIVLEKQLKCNSQDDSDSVHVSCSVVFAGNWDPLVECTQETTGKNFIRLHGNQTKNLDGNVVTSTWNFSSKNEAGDIVCSIESKHPDRPKESIAVYCSRKIEVMSSRAVLEELPPKRHLSSSDKTNCDSSDVEFRNLLTRVNQLESSAMKNQDAVAMIASQLSHMTNRIAGLSSADLRTSVIIISRLAYLRNNSISKPSRREIKICLQAISNVLQPINSKAWKELEEINRTIATSILFAVDVYGRSLSTHTISNQSIVFSDNLVLEAWILEKSNMPLHFEFPSSSARDEIRGDRVSISMKAIENSILPDARSTLRIWGSYYRTINDYLPGNKDSDVITSRVLSFSIGGLKTEASLHSAALVTLRHNQAVKMSLRRRCACWNFARGEWDSTRCSVISTNLTHTSCSCDRLENIAIIMTRTPSDDKVIHFISLVALIITALVIALTRKQAKAGQAAVILFIYFILIAAYISFIAGADREDSEPDIMFLASVIGCIISAFALILTVLVYALTWKQTGSAQATFLLNLCIALIIGNIIFMAGAGTIEFKGSCRIVTVLSYYFFLTSFFIILAESVELLLNIIIVSHVRRKFEIIALVASSWVLPAIIVAVTVAASKFEEYYDNGLPCWLSVDRSFMWVFICPVLCVMTVNFIILAILAIVLMRKSRERSFSAENVKKIQEIRATIWNMSVTCPLLGLCWLLDATSIVYSSVNVLCLSVIVKSLMGLLIFIFHANVHYKTMNDELSHDKSNYGWCICQIGNERQDNEGTPLTNTGPQYIPKEQQLPTIESKPTTKESKPSVTESKPTTTDSMPGTTESKPSATGSKPGTTDSKPGTTESKPGTTESKSTTTDSKPGTTESKPTTTDSKPGTTESKPSATGSKPGTTESKPSATGSKPGTTESKLTSIDCPETLESKH